MEGQIDWIELFLRRLGLMEVVDHERTEDWLEASIVERTYHALIMHLHLFSNAHILRR